MTTTPDNAGGSPPPQGFKSYAIKRILLAVAATLAAIWLVSFALEKLAGPAPSHLSEAPGTETPSAVVHAPPLIPHAPGAPGVEAPHPAAPPPAGVHATEAPDRGSDTPAAAVEHTPSAKAATAEHGSETPAPAPAPAAPHGAASPTAAAPGHAPAPHGAAPPVPQVLGVAFVDAFVGILDHEINQRFWGWRPNDIVEFTDNVNNFQLGVLEVARRTAEVLADRISRTGSTQAFDKDLERARNNVMINANQYWLPSAESSYADAIEQLRRYRGKLIDGTAPFFNRTDNLIPLLRAYVNLLGSCDDNLVKTREDSGQAVSWFRADDYFYYSQGVAHAMHAILQAAAVDFATTLEGRRGADEVMHHAITSLEHATHIHPWIIFDSSPSGFLANHRANLAAPISHARFYLDLLIETLST